MTNKKIIIGIIFLIIISFASYFFFNSKDILNLEDKSSSIKIGVAVPQKFLEEVCLFFQGIYMAVDEINADGGILGRQVEPIIMDDENNVTDALEVSQIFSKNENINVVIGHWNSNCTIASAQVYDMSDTILVSPISTAPNLTEMGYGKLISNTPNDNEIGNKLAEYSKTQGYKNIAIYYMDTPYGNNLANAMEDKCIELDINIIDRHTYFLNKEEFEFTYKKWKYMDVDAIFIADIITSSTNLIQWIRDENKEIPILGADGFDIEDFVGYLGENSNEIAYTTFLDSSPNNYRFKDFSRKFKKIYGVDPDYWAIKAYDSVYLIKQGMELAGSSTDISKIIKSLKDSGSLYGANGDYRLEENGKMIGEKIGIKKIINGEYEYLFNF